jgi:hypothetical protein
MNSPNEPEPASRDRAERCERAGRILRMTSQGREGFVRVEEELIGG